MTHTIKQKNIPLQTKREHLTDSLREKFFVKYPELSKKKNCEVKVELLRLVARNMFKKKEEQDDFYKSLAESFSFEPEDCETEKNIVFSKELIHYISDHFIKEKVFMLKPEELNKYFDNMDEREKFFHNLKDKLLMLFFTLGSNVSFQYFKNDNIKKVNGYSECA